MLHCNDPLRTACSSSWTPFIMLAAQTSRPCPVCIRTPQAYADYNDLMDMTEDMVSSMVKEIKGTYKIQYHANGPDQDPVEIDFTPPW